MLGQISKGLKLLNSLAFAFAMGLSIPVWAEPAENSDPFEGVNRAVFAFNEQADRFLLKPIAKGYRFITPDPVEESLGRVFDNVGEVVTIANDLFQGKFGQAANDTGRFLVNTTFGVVGIFDVASTMGLERNDKEDFGQTLGVWGVKSGPYLMLPLLGPSTLRDGPARFVDGYMNPINTVDDVPTRNSIYGTEIIVRRGQLLKAEELISGDKYAFIRDAYLQRRAFMVNDGDVEDDFGSDEFFDDFEDDYE